MRIILIDGVGNAVYHLLSQTQSRVHPMAMTALTEVFP